MTTILQSYTITLDDVQAYLDGKQDDEVIGFTCNSTMCLLTNAARQKYPRAQVIEIYFGCLFIDGQKIQLGWQMHNLYRRFDQLHQGSNYEIPITKREWLEQANAPKSEYE